MNDYYIKVNYPYLGKEIELIYDTVIDKFWLDKANLSVFSGIKIIPLSRKLCAMLDESIITMHNVKQLKKDNYKKFFVYDNKVIKKVINDDEILKKLLLFQKKFKNDYNMKVLGKIYFKNENLLINEEYINDHLFFAKDDLIKLLNDPSIINKDKYSLYELFDISFNNPQFNKWMHKILYKVLIDGYYINNEMCFNKKDKIIEITNIANNLINNDYLDNDDKYLYYKTVVKFNNKLYDSSIFISNLLNRAKERIIIIGNYLNDSIFDLLSNIYINIDIYTTKESYLTKDEIKQFKNNHDLKIINIEPIDETYLIIDNIIYYIDINLNNILIENSNIKIINTNIDLFFNSKIKKA